MLLKVCGPLEYKALKSGSQVPLWINGIPDFSTGSTWGNLETCHTYTRLHSSWSWNSLKEHSVEAPRKLAVHSVIQTSLNRREPRLLSNSGTFESFLLGPNTKCPWKTGDQAPTLHPPTIICLRLRDFWKCRNFNAKIVLGKMGRLAIPNR